MYSKSIWNASLMDIDEFIHPSVLSAAKRSMPCHRIHNFNKLLFKFEMNGLSATIIEQFSFNAFILNWIDMHAAHLNLNNIIKYGKENGKEITFSLCTPFFAIIVNAMPFNLSLNLFKIHVISIIHVFHSISSFFCLPLKLAYTKQEWQQRKRKKKEWTKILIQNTQLEFTHAHCVSQFIAGVAHLPSHKRMIAKSNLQLHYVWHAIHLFHFSVQYFISDKKERERERENEMRPF